MARSFLILVLMLVAGIARADDPAQRADAIALFDEARGLMQKGDYAAACPKLAQAQRLSPGVGILFNLADCYEHTGKLASAWAGFREAASLAAGTGRGEREADARRRAEALEPRLTRLKITVTEAVPGLRVTRNDLPVSEAQWGAAVPVDPALYVVNAEAPGKQPWKTTITAQEEGKTLEVVVPRLPDGGTAGPGPGPEPGPAPVPPPGSDVVPPPPVPEPDSDAGGGPSWQMPLGIGMFAVGGATAIAGVALAGVAKSKADGADCDEDDLCSQEGVDDRDQALLFGNVGTGLLIGGAVVGGVGLILWLTAPSAPAEGVALAIDPRGARLSLRW